MVNRGGHCTETWVAGDVSDQGPCAAGMRTHVRTHTHAHTHTHVSTLTLGHVTFTAPRPQPPMPFYICEHQQQEDPDRRAFVKKTRQR